MNIALSFVMWLFYALFSWPVVDVGRSALVVIFVFMLTFAVYSVWEIRAAFPNIRLEKRNTLHGAEILIWNNDVVDLTDLNVDIIQKTWITRESSVRIPINPNERSLDLGGINKVNYGGGVKNILVGSGKEGNATFHTNPLTLDTGHEHYDKADRSTYDVAIQVSGKIDSRPIFPRKLKGRLRYVRADQEFESVGKKEVLRNVLSRMEWEDIKDAT